MKLLEKLNTKPQAFQRILGLKKEQLHLLIERMSPLWISAEEKRKHMIECENSTLSLKKKCKLLNVSRSSHYYKPFHQEDDSAELINEIRDIYEEKPFYGYRRMTVALRERGFLVNHKKVFSLLQIAGIKAIYPKKNLSALNHKKTL